MKAFTSMRIKYESPELSPAAPNKWTTKGFDFAKTLSHTIIRKIIQKWTDLKTMYPIIQKPKCQHLAYILYLEKLWPFSVQQCQHH